MRCGATAHISTKSASSIGGHTFIGKQFLLGRSHIINAIERKAKLLGFVLRVRYSHNIHWFPFLSAFYSYNGIFIEFLVEEGSNARDDCCDVS